MNCYKKLYKLITENSLESTIIFIAFIKFIANILSIIMHIKSIDYFIQLTNDIYLKKKIDYSIKNFFIYSFITCCLKYIPYILFNYHLQDVERNGYVYNLKQIMMLKYHDFINKTPGELYYLIYIKSTAYHLLYKIVLSDIPSLLTVLILNAIKINNIITKNIIFIFIITVFLIHTFALFKYLEIKRKYHYNYLMKEKYVSSKLSDKLLNYTIIKSYNMENFELNNFAEIIKLQTHAYFVQSHFDHLVKYILNILTSIYFILLLIIIYCISLKNSLNKTSLMIILLFKNQTNDFKKLEMDIDQLFEQINQIFFLYKDISTETKHLSLNQQITFNRQIIFENVNIIINKNIILNNINLTIEKGQKVAIIGKNGSGKTSFIKTLLGLLQYTGNIKIDDYIVKNYTLNSLHNLMSYISQEDYTSDDTVLNNLFLGFDKTYLDKLTLLQKMEIIENVINKLNFKSFIETLENGYNTIVGQRGTNLSAGQKQKLSIIRAFIKNSPIFLFDEITASIDQQTEKQIIDIILNQCNEKTIFMIIHNINYLKYFDKIIFLNNNNVESIDVFDKLIINANFKLLFSINK